MCFAFALKCVSHQPTVQVNAKKISLKESIVAGD